MYPQPGDPTGGGFQRVEHDDTKTYVFTVTPNAAGGVDFLRRLPCGEFCFSDSDFTNIQFAPAAGQPFGVGTYSQAQRYSRTPGSRPGLLADEQGRDVGSCGDIITGSFTVLELVRAADGTVQRFAADFEQHCKGQTAAVLGGLRFNSDIPYAPPSRFALASIRFTSDANEPITGGGTGGFVVTDGRTSAGSLTHNAVGIKLFHPDGVAEWIVNFSAPANEVIQVGTYSGAVFPRTSPSQASLEVSNRAGLKCLSNTATVQVREIEWSEMNQVVRFAADITVNCTSFSAPAPPPPCTAPCALNAGVRFNSTEPYLLTTSTIATTDLPEGTMTLSIESPSSTCVLRSPAVLYPAASQVPVPLPKYVAPLYAALSFRTDNCGAGQQVAFTVEFPQDLPPTAQWWRYGPTPDNHTPHWYTIASTVSGNLIKFNIEDGGLGDDDLLLNSSISDLGMLGVPGGPYQDLWWAGESENGWGMTIAQHRDVLFANLFVYDAQGAPTWYVMPSGSWNAGHNVYTGGLYQPKGAPFSAYDASRFDLGARIGTATLVFSDVNNASFDFNVSGVGGHKSITRVPFGIRAAQIDPLGDLWWGGITQNGWGMALMQQYSALFGLWFTYDASGKATWFAMPAGTWIVKNDYQGKIYRAAGPPWLGVPYDASRHRLTEAGTFRYRFSGDAATFDFTVDGKSGTVPLTRLPF